LSEPETLSIVVVGNERLRVPTVLPILPVRDAVVFPGMNVPLSVGRPRSLAALEEAGDGGFLVVATQKSPETEEPELGGGERLEDAVVREVHEEAGIVVGDVRYFGSQPWPFPSSLMLGFLARATTTEIRLEDELVEARWFTRDELYLAVRDRAVLLPPPVSIARRLIESWFGGELPNPNG